MTRDHAANTRCPARQPQAATQGCLYREAPGRHYHRADTRIDHFRYDKLSFPVDSGPPHKPAVIACARRMLGILNAMLRDGLIWQDTKVGQGQFLP
jgi:hypothetical protein